MEIVNNKWIIQINSKVFFDTKNSSVKIDDLDVNFPWEYEKWGILLEVKEYESKLFYNFSINWKTLLIITNDKFEQKEEILSFFWDVDVLLIIWTKDSVKVFENIESRVVIPYWEWKDIFLNTLWQTGEEIKVYKSKADSPSDETEFVNLA